MYVLVVFLVDVEQQICPVLIELCSIDSTDDFRTEAVTVSIFTVYDISFFFVTSMAC